MPEVNVEVEVDPLSTLFGRSGQIEGSRLVDGRVSSCACDGELSSSSSTPSSTYMWYGRLSWGLIAKFGEAKRIADAEGELWVCSEVSLKVVRLPALKGTAEKTLARKCCVVDGIEGPGFFDNP